MAERRLILTVNAGSSSLRLAAYACDGALQRLAAWRGAAGSTHRCLGDFVSRHGLSPVDRVAHRVVHGGDIRDSQPVDAHVEAQIERFAPFAPLHNPAALEAIRACRAVLGAQVPQIAVFDTAFFADLPEVARTYALPREICSEHGLRRYGFHGLAHRSMEQLWNAARGGKGGRVISLQLGSGCSIAAVKDGRAVDTSMGFSPLEGLVMATRCGDTDPGLLIHLQRSLGWTPEQLDEVLNRQSGLLGVSGASADMRELLASDEPAARLAIDLFCYRARKYVGAYLAVLGGADAILFGGGVGENAGSIRERILAGMDWAGIELDAGRNRDAAPGTPVCVSSQKTVEGTGTAVWVMPVDESRILAQEALDA